MGRFRGRLWHAGMATLPFHLLDVFTTGAAMTGNQLLVIEDMDDTLTDDSMLAIAKEIGFAESAFVRSTDVRIFTTDEEVPQAGHPVLGLAEVVAGARVDTGGTVTLNTKKGPITVRCDGGGIWTASQDPAEWAADLLYTEVASRLKTSPKAVVGADSSCLSFPVGSTCGLKYALVPMSSKEQLAALVVDPSAEPMPDPDVWLCEQEVVILTAAPLNLPPHHVRTPALPRPFAGILALAASDVGFRTHARTHARTHHSS